MKCKICGKRFKLSAENVYIASDSTAVLQILAGTVKAYDAVDCPKCGCQTLLCERISMVGDDNG